MNEIFLGLIIVLVTKVSDKNILICHRSNFLITASPFKVI